MDEMNTDGQQYESKDDIGGGADVVKFWLDAIALSEKDEKTWRDEADNVMTVYRGEKSKDSGYDQELDFNILHANVETILPAIYNSSPTPDIRRRFGDKDILARTVSQLLERAVSYYQDQYDFDATMHSLLFDGAVAGRGVARIRYIPYVSQEGDRLDYEEVKCEYVNWRRFRCGKADTWDEMPWIAFEHFLSKDELKRIADPEIVKNISFDYSVKDERQSVDDVPDVYKRARVWEIWDKESREVLFIATGYGEKPIAKQRDPLGLEGFFPVPRPIMPIYTPGRMVPVCPYSIYRSLAEELNTVTRRIKRIVASIKVKAAYAAGASDLGRLAEAGDQEMIGVEGLEQLLAGGIDKGIAWWPIEPAVKALQQLYQQREQIKATIYEVTGISDIVRGHSAASETATAQQIKTQWGSLRVQKLQNEVQRFARDIYRLESEVIANNFDIKTLQQVTGMKLLSQAEKQQVQQMMQAQQQPQQPGQPPMQQPPIPAEVQQAMKEASIEEVQQILQNDLMRSYRIDIESDSTIRADLTRQQKTMQEFLNGTSQFLGAAGPIVQSGIMNPQPLIEIYASFARMFKLGKQADDALEQLSEAAREAPPQQNKPDPAAEKAKADLAKTQGQLELKKAELELKKIEMQASQQAEAAKLQIERQKAALEQERAAAELEMKGQEAATNNELKEAELEQRDELERAKLETDAMIAADRLELDEAKAEAEIALKSRTALDNFDLAVAKTANNGASANGQ